MRVPWSAVWIMAAPRHATVLALMNFIGLEQCYLSQNSVRGYYFATGDIEKCLKEAFECCLGPWLN